MEHPELANGGAAYVEGIRSERDVRFEESLERQARGRPTDFESLSPAQK